jgi:hypothetical protein
MTLKQTHKKYLLIMLLANLFLAWANLAYAQQQAADYSKSNVQAGIEKYLCAPKSGGGSYWSTDGTYFGSSPDKTVGANNKAQNDLYNCINKLYKFAIAAGSVAGIAMIVIAGYVYMSAEGSQESVDKAKNILVSTITAMVILFGGYVLLRAINPDLIGFQNIQPPSIRVPTTTPPGTIPVAGAKHTAAELTSAGCAFQGTIGQQAPGMVEALFTKVQSVCQASSGQNFKPQISSITGGQHATNSYHYKGCAVDFAGGDPNYYNSPVGQAVVKAALSAGISQSRINPPPDDTKPDHVHIDLGTSCPN